MVERAASDRERGLGQLPLEFAEGTLGAIVQAADGDARRALGLLEAATAVHRQGAAPHSPLEPETVKRAAGQRLLLHDRDREEHFNVVSAFIKSLRASDPDAALYYLARMLEAGEDPLYPARRLLIFASEDIGNADPEALSVATATHLAVERLGMPEARIPLAQATAYLACAPKSNAAYRALGLAQQSPARDGLGSRAAPPAQRPDRPDEGARATAQTTSTPTTSPTRSWRGRTCPRPSPGNASTSPPNEVQRRRSPGDWRSYDARRTQSRLPPECRLACSGASESC